MKRKTNPKSLRELAFVDGDRIFSCNVAPRRAAEPERWWWFSVSTGGHRYAPFLAADDDTAESVASRIVAYYDNHMAHRAAPVLPPWRRGSGPAKSPATPPSAVGRSL